MINKKKLLLVKTKQKIERKQKKKNEKRKKREQIERIRKEEYYMKKLCIISTKNPTNILINTISKVKEYYSDFDIIIIDSDSDNMKTFKKIPSDIKIELIKNKNWELGAWYYAFNEYNNYDIYMFIQDSLVPIEPFKLEYYNILKSDYLYSFHYQTKLKNKGYLQNLRDIYKDTELNFISKMSGNTRITGAAHNSFIANSNITKKILQLEKVYIDKKLIKSKIDSWLSERTVGIMADKYSKKRINITSYFKKFHLKRDVLNVQRLLVILTLKNIIIFTILSFFINYSG